VRAEVTPNDVSALAVASGLREVTEEGDGGAVLVASDDPDLRRRICRPLVEHGFDVVEVVDASAALELAPRFVVDVAVIDVGGSETGAAELLPRRQDVHRGGYVPVVLVGAGATCDDVGVAIHLGAHDYLLPPVDDISVLARVHSAVEGKRRHDAIRRRMTELQELVRTDSLTGLYNRRHIDAELAALASAARRQRTPLAVLLVDVDRFKRINDRLSHEAGDGALRTVADRIRAIVRAEDVVGRWGGDEFVIVLPSTDREAALTLAQRLRREVSRPGSGALPAIPLTVSVGCAAGWDPEPAALISAADAALHRAKAAGRNRVSL
jgi:two-component system cell cycle response regulator